MQYNIDDGSGGSDVGMYHQALTGILTEQNFISDCRYRVIESSSLVPVLFGEVFSHPYISFFSFSSEYSVDVYLLCMIKVRVRWYTCSL